MSLLYNDIAERLLSVHELESEPEPEWVSGRVPDFYCTGRIALWVEVKSLAVPKEIEVSGRALQWFRERSETVRYHGKAFAVVSDDMSQRDVKLALRIVDRLLGRMKGQEASPGRVFIVIPKDPEYDRFVRIEAQSDSGLEVYHCCRSASGKYGRPFLGGEISTDRRAIVIDEDEQSREAWPGDLGLFNDDFRLALEVNPADKPFSVYAVTARGIAKPIPTVKKIREDAADANKKFVNACKYCEAPCLLMVFHDDLLVSDDIAFQSVFYGNMQVHFSTDPAEDDLPLSLGQDGVWGPDKNRTTSAACYIRNNAAPIVVHNYWAKNRLPTGLFGCVEYVPKKDGSIEKLDPTSTA